MKRKRVSYRGLMPFVLLLILGGGLILFGAVNYERSTRVRNEVRSEEDIKNDVDAKYDESARIRNERNEIEDHDSEKYRELSDRLTEVEAERADLEQELLNVKNGVYDNLRMEATFDMAPFLVIGILLVALGAGGATRWAIENRRLNRKEAKILSSVQAVPEKKEK